MRNIKVFREIHKHELAKVRAYGLESKAAYIKRRGIKGLAKTPEALARQSAVQADLFHPEIIYPVYTLFSFWVDDEANHVANGWISKFPKKFDESTMTIADYL
ncbi:hypothetical protein KY331_03720, partial [Candidatus Woesearchaeota archaeon]|nr:hypothetical protein [Candidatus Woesearchaeota archaeon]